MYAINRKQAKDIIFELANGRFTNLDRANAEIKLTYKRFLELPILDIETPKGKWELSEGVLSYEGTFDGYFCSECGKGFLDDLCCNNGADEIRVNQEFNFCPFCGADMRGEQ